MLLLFCWKRQREGTLDHSGADVNEIYRSKWFDFIEIHFLNDQFKPRTIKDTINTSTYNF